MLTANQAQQFTLGFNGNTPVEWSLSPAIGSVTSSGLYTAPATISSQTVVYVKATSKNGSGSATVTLTPPTGVSVAMNPPASVSLWASQSQQFSATVSGTTNTSVTWSLSPGVGTISTSGVYTAPSSISSQQNVTVTATSVADPTLSAKALVTLMPNVWITPGSATMTSSQSQQFSLNSAPGVTAVNSNWSIKPKTGSISSTGLYTAPASVASPEQVTITCSSNGSWGYSASATVMLVPAASVSVTPGSVSLGAGQAQQFTASVTGATNTSVTWSLNAALGTISSTGLYTAPAAVTTQQTVTVTATSAADPTKSASATVTLNAVAISVSPGSVTLAASQTQAFTAAVTASTNTSVTWSLSPAVGTISSAGLYTAPAAVTAQQTVTATATSAADPTKSASATVTLSPATISVSPASVTLAASQTQSFTAAVTGYTNTSVTWSLSAPVGTISSAGLYTAPATITTQQTVTATATSAADPTKSASATVTLVTPPKITTTSLPNGTTSTSYSATLSATGGLPPYSWSIASGSLPPGLSLATTTGIISGTPTTAGSYNVSMQVADGVGQRTSVLFSLAVVLCAGCSPSLTISTATLPNGAVGVAYSFALASSGGTPPVTWSLASGQLPSGLSLSASGSISGTPTTASSYSFTIKASDSAGNTQTQAFTVGISAVGTTTLTITPTDLLNGIAGASYAATLSAAGGTPPYTWSVPSGALPAGLTLNNSTGAISGTPTAVGWSNFFTIQVNDAAGNFASLPYSINIMPVLDQYGGSPQLACTATGWFHPQKIGSHWWLCDPQGGAFFYQGVGAMVPGGSGSDTATGQSYNLDAITIQKYGDESYHWGPAQNNRLLSWGFNSVGQMSTGMVQPMATCSSCSWPGGVQPVKLPTVQTLVVSNYAGVNLWNYASGATKNMMFGINNNYRGWRASIMDFYDPVYNQWLNNYFINDSGFIRFANSPWTVGLFIDDTDWFWGMGAGPDYHTVPAGHTNSDPAYMVMITSPMQTFNPNPSYGGISVLYSDTKVYSKVAAPSGPPATCSMATPCSLRDYLYKKYNGNIGALNTAWGSNYTTFDSAGTQVNAEVVGTGDGSTTSFSHTLARTPVSPDSILIKVNGTPQGGDCPWFNGSCNTAIPATGTLSGPSGTTIVTGSQPWLTDFTFQSCGGCSLPPASYWVKIAYHMNAGFYSSASREVGGTIQTMGSQIVVTPPAPVANATGWDVYVSCANQPGGTVSWCSPAGTLNNNAETLQASNIPFGQNWVEPVTGLTTTGAGVPPAPSVVNYANGQVNVTFATPPAAGQPITMDYFSNGWMYGTGLMDEDGRNTSWLGTNAYCLSPATACDGSDNPLPNANPNVAADLDGWISQFSAKYFNTIRTNLKNHAPNIMYLGADTVGTWGVPARKEILKAASQYVDALFVNMFPGLPDPATYNSMYQYLTQYFGDKPLLLFLTAHATQDSALFRYSASGQVIGFPGQPNRGQSYANYLNSMLNTASYNGTYQWVGISWWGLYDFWNEKTNWGLVSLNDNPYDGKASCQAAGLDQWGYSTGGEGVMSTWTAGTAYSLMPTANAPIQVNISGTLYVFAPLIAGISGNAPPVWPTSPGATVTDNTVTWQNIGTKSAATCSGNTIDYVKQGNALWYNVLNGPQ